MGRNLCYQVSLNLVDDFFDIPNKTSTFASDIIPARDSKGCIYEHNTMDDTERLVKEQLKKGNEEAYRYLYKNHYALLCHVAYGYVSDDYLAETLVGDVMVHLWEVRETLNIQSSLRSYLIKAVRNRCIDYLSSKYEKNEITFSALGENETIKEHYLLSDSYPLGTLLERELEEEILNAIQQLPEECRRVFLKSRFEEKKYEEISQELGISVNTVKYHIKRALSFLYERLNKYILYLVLLFSALK